MNTLGLSGQKLADGEVLCHAFERWGDLATSHIIGRFCVCCFLYPDAYPVCCGRPHESLSAVLQPFRSQAGSLHTLAALPSFLGKGEPDIVALGVAVEARFESGSTPFKDIRRLSGGEQLRWVDGVAAIERWWEPHGRRIIFRQPEEYVEAARELFDRSVQACLRSSAPVSATLSGGLDSGLVTATAAREVAMRGAGYARSLWPLLPMFLSITGLAGGR